MGRCTPSSPFYPFLLEIDFPSGYVLLCISEFTRNFVARLPSHCNLVMGGENLRMASSFVQWSGPANPPGTSCWLTLEVAQVPCSDLPVPKWGLGRSLLSWGWTMIAVLVCSWCWCPLYKALGDSLKGAESLPCCKPRVNLRSALIVSHVTLSEHEWASCPIHSWSLGMQESPLPITLWCTSPVSSNIFFDGLQFATSLLV